LGQVPTVRQEQRGQVRPHLYGKSAIAERIDHLANLGMQLRSTSGQINESGLYFFGELPSRVKDIFGHGLCTRGGALLMAMGTRHVAPQTNIELQ